MFDYQDLQPLDSICKDSWWDGFRCGIYTYKDTSVLL